LNSVLIIPNKEENMSCEQYCEIVEKILEKELLTENNYVNKIKNHEQIFNNFNYFKTPLCYPIKNAVEHIKSLAKQLKPANLYTVRLYGRIYGRQYRSKYGNQYIRSIYPVPYPCLKHRLDVTRYTSRQYGRLYTSQNGDPYIRSIYHNNPCPYLSHRLDPDRYYMFV
jgi:hypothetical protein